MFEPLSNREKQLVKLVEHYEKQNINLQVLTGTNLDQLLEIARVCTLYIDINGEKRSLSNIVDIIKRTNLPFEILYSNMIQLKKEVEFAGIQLRKMLNDLKFKSN